MPVFVGDFGAGELDPTGAGRAMRGAAENLDSPTGPGDLAALAKQDPNAAAYLFGPDGKGINPQLSGAVAGYFAQRLGLSGGAGDPRVKDATLVIAQLGPQGLAFATVYGMIPPGARRVIEPYLGSGIDIAKAFAQGTIDPWKGLSGPDFSSWQGASQTFGSYWSLFTPWGLIGSVLGAFGIGLPDWGDVEPQLRGAIQGVMDKAGVPITVDRIGLPSLPDVGDLVDAFSNQDTAKIMGWLKSGQINATVKANLIPADIVDLAKFFASIPTGGAFQLDMSKGSQAFQTAGATAGTKLWLDLSKSPPVAWDVPA